MKYVAHWPIVIFSLDFLSRETCFDSYFLSFFQTIDCLNNNVTKFCNEQDKYLYIDFEFLNENELSRANFKLLVTAEKVYKCKFCFLKNQWCCTHHQCTITEQADTNNFVDVFIFRRREFRCTGVWNCGSCYRSHHYRYNRWSRRVYIQKTKKKDAK